MSKRLALLALLAGWCGCDAPLPVDRWALLNEYRQQLASSEAATYLPEAFEAFESSVSDVAARLRPDLSIDRRPRSERLEGEIDRLLTAASDLEADLCTRKEELQRRQDQALGFFREHLDSADRYGQFPELAGVIGRLEASLDRLRPFHEPGTYRTNLAALGEAETLFEELRVRWRRYSGTEMPTEALEAELVAFREAADELRPEGAYVVIDTALNTLSVRQGEEVLLEAVCSIGSGHRMVADGQYWEFDTPRGEFTVTRKIREPSWRKPDWAFLEEGEAVPSHEKDRIEHGSLGAFAFEFAPGYFIHGTLYKRLLGQPVTHGCIRLEDTDLLQVAGLIGKGSRVLIF